MSSTGEYLPKVELFLNWIRQVVNVFLMGGLFIVKMNVNVILCRTVLLEEHTYRTLIYNSISSLRHFIFIFWIFV